MTCFVSHGETTECRALLVMACTGALLKSQTWRSCSYSHCHSLSRRSACISSSNSQSGPVLRMPKTPSKLSKSMSRQRGRVKMPSPTCMSIVRRTPTRSFCHDYSTNEPGEESRLPHFLLSSNAALFQTFSCPTFALLVLFLCDNVFEPYITIYA